MQLSFWPATAPSSLMMLSSADFVGRRVHGSISPFEMLIDVFEVAAEIYVKEKAFMKQKTHIIKEKLLKKPATTTDHDRDIFVASSSRRKRSYERLSEIEETDSKFKNQKVLFRTLIGGNPSNKKNLILKHVVTFDIPNARPKLPDDLKNRIKATDGSDVVMIIQKALTATNVKKCQARLSMPFRQVNMDFLREGERDYLRHQKEMKVTFIEPPGMFGEIVLRQWDMRKPREKTSSMYVLRKCWHDVTLTNNHQDDDVVQVWSFRVGSTEVQRL